MMCSITNVEIKIKTNKSQNNALKKIENYCIILNLPAIILSRTYLYNMYYSITNVKMIPKE